MDIHTWCAIPEPELARQSFFYMDDVSLQVIEEPPLAIATPLDEYFVGELVPWTVQASATNGILTVTLWCAGRQVAEQTMPAGSASLQGRFETVALPPGLYTLRARMAAAGPQAEVVAERQVILAPDPFAW